MKNNIIIYLLIIILVLAFFIHQNSLQVKKNKLIHYLNSIQGDGILIGQASYPKLMGYPNTSFVEFDMIKNMTGKELAIMNMNYYRGTNESAKDLINESNFYIKEWNKKGGITMLTLDMINPITNQKFISSMNDSDFSLLSVKGTAQNNLLNKELDYISEGLSQLQKDKIIVLLRPYGEMNLLQNWWGNKNPQDFIKLWVYTYEYFKEKGLKNILWVYCPSANSNDRYIEYYPNYKGMVDIVSLDYYSASPQENLSAYNQLLSLGKPFGFSEFSCLSGLNVPNGSTCDSQIWLNASKNYYKNATFLISYSWTWSLTHQTNLNTTLNDNYIITLEKLP